MKYKIPRITSTMLSSQPDQTSFILNKAIDELNKIEKNGGGGGDIEVVQETGSSRTAVMSQNAVTVSLDTKVDKEAGKELSSNDFTDSYRTKLDTLKVPHIIDETIYL